MRTHLREAWRQVARQVTMVPVLELIDWMDPNVSLDMLLDQESHYLWSMIEGRGLFEGMGMRQHGILDPLEVKVRVDGSKVIWDGNHRVAAALLLGLDELPVRYVKEGLLQKVASGKPVWDMTQGEFQSIVSRLVYHSSTYERDYVTLLTQGVRMANIPNNLGRQRYEMGEYAEFAPGAGIAKGLYVSRPIHHVFGYGNYIVGIEVSMSDLAIPPENEYHRQYGTIDSALASHDGAIIVRDRPASAVHAVAERYTHEVPDPWQLANDSRWRKPGEQIADRR